MTEMEIVKITAPMTAEELCSFLNDAITALLFSQRCGARLING